MYRVVTQKPGAAPFLATQKHGAAPILRTHNADVIIFCDDYFIGRFVINGLIGVTPKFGLPEMFLRKVCP